jgi:hypothetical protein
VSRNKHERASTVYTTNLRSSNGYHPNALVASPLSSALGQRAVMSGGVECVPVGMI